MKEFAALNSHDPVVALGEASGEEDIDSRVGLLALDDDDDEGEELAQLKALDQCALLIGADLAYDLELGCVAEEPAIAKSLFGINLSR